MEELFGGTPIELKPGMVLRYDKIDWSSESTVDGYMLYLRSPGDDVFEGYDLETSGGSVLFRTSLRVRARSVSAVYDSRDGKLFAAYAIPYIMSPDRDSAEQMFRHRVTVWERTEPVREMTVNESSKALGYKVKVVGGK